MIYVHHVPVYWAVEHDAVDPTLLTRSHMQETAPPFRMSRWAFRIRVSLNTWLHIGTYRYHVERNYWGIGATANQIGSWATNGESKDPRAARDSDPGATPADDRVQHEPDGGVLRRAEQSPDEPGLVVERDGDTGSDGLGGDPDAP